MKENLELLSVELGTGSKLDKGTTMAPYSADYFYGQLNTLRRILTHQSGCSGIAIHNYRALAEMEKRP